MHAEMLNGILLLIFYFQLSKCREIRMNRLCLDFAWEKNAKIEPLTWIRTVDLMRTFQVQNSGRIETWPKGVVPYSISDRFSRIQRTKILLAIRYLHEFSCVRFTHHTESAYGIDYLHFTPSDKGLCSSHIGRLGAGMQTMRLADHCFERSTILHELMHALGFHHEHSRVDRDPHISVQWDNVNPNYTRHFQTHPMSDHMYSTPYDHTSIVHYDSLTGSVNEKPTILKSGSRDRIERAHTLSLMDAIRLNTLYRCRIDRCIDQYPHCDRYARSGACQRIPGQMAVLCKSTCGWSC